MEPLRRMRVVSWRRLREFAQAHPKSSAPLKAWWTIMHSRNYPDPDSLKQTFGKRVDFLPKSIVIFDVGGNRYRISTRIRFRAQRTYVRRVMTHEQYDAAIEDGAL